MDLRDFVAESLIQICGGVRQANKKLDPAKDDTPVFVLDSARDHHSSAVDFDVAVTLKEGDKAGVEGKLQLAVFEANFGVNGSSAKETVSRIKFKVCLNQDVE